MCAIYIYYIYSGWLGRPTLTHLDVHVLYGNTFSKGCLRKPICAIFVYFEKCCIIINFAWFFVYCFMYGRVIFRALYILLVLVSKGQLLLVAIYNEERLIFMMSLSSSLLVTSRSDVLCVHRETCLREFSFLDLIPILLGVASSLSDVVPLQSDVSWPLRERIRAMEPKSIL